MLPALVCGMLSFFTELLFSFLQTFVLRFKSSSFHTLFPISPRVAAMRGASSAPSHAVSRDGANVTPSNSSHPIVGGMSDLKHRFECFISTNAVDSCDLFDFLIDALPEGFRLMPQDFSHALHRATRHRYEATNNTAALAPSPPAQLHTQAAALDAASAMLPPLPTSPLPILEATAGQNTAFPAADALQRFASASTQPLSSGGVSGGDSGLSAPASVGAFSPPLFLTKAECRTIYSHLMSRFRFQRARSLYPIHMPSAYAPSKLWLLLITLLFWLLLPAIWVWGWKIGAFRAQNDALMRLNNAISRRRRRGDSGAKSSTTSRRGSVPMGRTNARSGSGDEDKQFSTDRYQQQHQEHQQQQQQQQQHRRGRSSGLGAALLGVDTRTDLSTAANSRVSSPDFSSSNGKQQQLRILIEPAMLEQHTTNDSTSGTGYSGRGESCEIEDAIRARSGSGSGGGIASDSYSNFADHTPILGPPTPMQHVSSYGAPGEHMYIDAGSRAQSGEWAERQQPQLHHTMEALRSMEVGAGMPHSYSTLDVVPTSADSSASEEKSGGGGAVDDSVVVLQLPSHISAAAAAAAAARSTSAPVSASVSSDVNSVGPLRFDSEAESDDESDDESELDEQEELIQQLLDEEQQAEQATNFLVNEAAKARGAAAIDIASNSAASAAHAVDAANAGDSANSKTSQAAAWLLARGKKTVGYGSTSGSGPNGATTNSSETAALLSRRRSSRYSDASSSSSSHSFASHSHGRSRKLARFFGYVRWSYTKQLASRSPWIVLVWFLLLVAVLSLFCFDTSIAANIAQQEMQHAQQPQQTQPAVAPTAPAGVASQPPPLSIPNAPSAPPPSLTVGWFEVMPVLASVALFLLLDSLREVFLSDDDKIKRQFIQKFTYRLQHIKCVHNGMGGEADERAAQGENQERQRGRRASVTSERYDDVPQENVNGGRERSATMARDPSPTVAGSYGLTIAHPNRRLSGSDKPSAPGQRSTVREVSSSGEGGSAGSGAGSSGVSSSSSAYGPSLSPSSASSSRVSIVFPSNALQMFEHVYRHRNSQRTKYRYQMALLGALFIALVHSLLPFCSLLLRVSRSELEEYTSRYRSRQFVCECVYRATSICVNICATSALLRTVLGGLCHWRVYQSMLHELSVVAQSSAPEKSSGASLLVHPLLAAVRRSSGHSHMKSRTSRLQLDLYHPSNVSAWIEVRMIITRYMHSGSSTIQSIANFSRHLYAFTLFFLFLQLTIDGELFTQRFHIDTFELLALFDSVMLLTVLVTHMYLASAINMLMREQVGILQAHLFHIDAMCVRFREQNRRFKLLSEHKNAQQQQQNIAAMQAQLQQMQLKMQQATQAGASPQPQTSAPALSQPLSASPSPLLPPSRPSRGSEIHMLSVPGAAGAPSMSPPLQQSVMSSPDPYYGGSPPATMTSASRTLENTFVFPSPAISAIGVTSNSSGGGSGGTAGGGASHGSSGANLISSAREMARQASVASILRDSASLLSSSIQLLREADLPIKFLGHALNYGFLYSAFVTLLSITIIAAANYFNFQI